MITIFTALIYPLALSVTAFVITNILTQPDMILSVLYHYPVNVWKWPTWITKPLIDCPYCMAGQWALWSYPFIFDYNPFMHVWVIIWALFGVDVLIKKMT